MTYIEKLKANNPGLREEIIEEVIDEECPSGLEDCPYWENTHPDCEACWNREIPEVKVVNSIGVLRSGPHDKPWEPTIKDSGDRTQFESGAVRDMRVGKGRCDLTPLEVISTYMETVGDGVEGIISNIAEFKRSGYTDTKPLYIALNEFCIEAYNGIYPTMFLEVAKHYEEGAKKYGEANWTLGIPAYCYIDSAVRHYFKWVRGDTCEFHNRAFVWNLLCCIWEVDYREKKDVMEDVNT